MDTRDSRMGELKATYQLALIDFHQINVRQMMYSRGNHMLRLRMVGCRDLRDFTKGKEYLALHGVEQGIFIDRPYVTVHNDSGRAVCLHLCRFEPLGALELYGGKYGQ